MCKRLWQPQGFSSTPSHCLLNVISPLEMTSDPFSSCLVNKSIKAQREMGGQPSTLSLSRSSHTDHLSCFSFGHIRYPLAILLVIISLLIRVSLECWDLLPLTQPKTFLCFGKVEAPKKKKGKNASFETEGEFQSSGWKHMCDTQFNIHLQPSWPFLDLEHMLRYIICSSCLNRWFKWGHI